MFNLIIIAISGLIILVWICIKLKSWKQRLILLLTLFIAIPAGMLYWFQWGWNSREKKLKEAQQACRQIKAVDELNIIFSGYSEQDLLGGISTMHKESSGRLLKSELLAVDTLKGYDGTISVVYHYKHSFRSDDIIEVKVGIRLYRLSNFVLTAKANYNMGGAVVSGCRIDSMDINGTRTALDQNFIIHKTDEF